MHLVHRLVAIAALLVPTVASVASAEARLQKPSRTARLERTQKMDASKKRGCLKAPVEIVAGGARGESATIRLAKCDGSPAPFGVDELSILARPFSAQRPKQSLESLAHSHGAEVAPGIRRVDPRLVERLELVVDHFRKAGQSPRVLLVSGYRPRSTGSFHSAGRALDFRIEGVSNEALLEFCKTLSDTGCGYYPNSVFVHMDVRDAGAGHVNWIDVSRPGESPKYVSGWPPAGEALPTLPAVSEAVQTSAAAANKRDLHPYLF